MANNIITCLLEGPHDAAFLYKILKSHDFKDYKGQIKELPQPIYGLLSNPKYFSNVKIEEMTVEFANKRIYPCDILVDDKSTNYILLYPLLGTSNTHLREKIINTFDDVIITGDEFAADFSNDNTFSIAYFLDADQVGVAKTVESVNKEISTFFPKIKFNGFKKNKEVTKIGDLEIGLYIITEYQKETGKLEDVLIPIMRENNEDIFEHAEAFLSIHDQTKLFKDKLKRKDDGTIYKVNDIKYDHKKSLVGTIGQLQKSGMTNTVCIKQADYLTNEKIKLDHSCNDILSFVKSLIK